MSTGRTMAAVAGVVLLSLLAAVTYGLGEPDGSGDPVVFVQVWLAGSVVGVTLVLVVGLVAAAAVEPARLVPLRRRRRSDHGATRAQILELRATETLLATVSARPRTHANRLRPRLDALTSHHLAPEDRAAVLGDVAWMVDPSVEDRAPSLDEIERFLDRVLSRARIDDR